MIVDLFAGPGGWEEGAKAAGLVDIVGLELDVDACSTAAAAGHRRIRADVAAYPAEQFAGVDGLIASPPCPPFSAAGKKMGRRDVPAIRAHMHAAGRSGRWTTPEVAWADPTSALTLEPLRWILATRPAWVALEQVPDALVLWQTYALVLEDLGYHVWCGIVDAADYGVPQNRRRAIFTAHRSRRAGLAAHHPRRPARRHGRRGRPGPPRRRRRAQHRPRLEEGRHPRRRPNSAGDQAGADRRRRPDTVAMGRRRPSRQCHHRRGPRPPRVPPRLPRRRPERKSMAAGRQRRPTTPRRRRPRRNLPIKSVCRVLTMCEATGHTEHMPATQALAAMLAAKVAQAEANGATPDQAIAAVRALWLEALQTEEV